MIRRPAKTKIHNTIVFVAALLVVTSPAVSQKRNDPWSKLEAVRANLLKAGPVAAEFSVTNTSDISQKVEIESGRLAIALPGCIRWDYQQPTVKSFLVCDGKVNQWNHDDGTGRRYSIAYENEPSIAFFLLDLDLLRKQYSASGRPVAGGTEISLTLKGESDYESSAVFIVGPKDERITEVTYKMYGNVTRWVIGKYETLGNRALFSPPTNIRWEEG